MEQYKIDRINGLARLAGERELTPEEEAERAALRREYVDAVLSSLTARLDNTCLIDEAGNKRKLRKK